VTTPGMSGYKVTLDDLQAAATYVQNRATTINQQIEALGQYAQGLQEFWTGPAQTAFETLMADYRTYANMLDNALTDISQGLNGNFVNYSDAEQANINSLVNVQLPAPNFAN
jgi:WXG100 family type VII secretion target